MKPLAVGMIGVGDLTLKQHLPNVQRCDWLRADMLCDLKAERLEQGLALASGARATTDYREVLADPGIDLVVVALAPERHAPIAIEALRAGKHVYVEKPLAEDVATAMRVAEVARKAGRHIAVGFNRRFAPAYRDAYSLVSRDRGPLMLTYRLVDDHRDRAGHWQGRSRLLDECCHVFDVFNWFARARPIRLFATGIGRNEDYQIVVEYANGVTASLFTSASGAFHWPKERIEIVGDNKVVAVEDFVELQSGGIPGWETRRYAGCEYPGFSRGYGKMFASLGLPFYRELRAHMGDLLLNSGLLEQCPGEDKWTAVARHFPEHLRMPINYACDKGWYAALTGFGQAILEGQAPDNADAEAGALTVLMSLAAQESVRTGQPQAIPAPA